MKNDSVVYFALDTDAWLLKVGRSFNGNRRLRQLENGSGRHLKLLGTVPGAEAAERKMHEALTTWDPTCRVGGEWFRVTPEVVARISQIVEDNERAILVANLERSVAAARRAKKLDV